MMNVTNHTDFVLSYAGGHLDRADRLRKDSKWILDRLSRSDSCIVPVWRDHNHIDRMNGNAQNLATFARSSNCTARLIGAASESVFLGLDGDTALFAVDLSHHEQEHAVALVNGGAFVDVRTIVSAIGPQEAALLAYARGLLHWHRHHRYCGQCGYATASRRGGHMRACLRNTCARETFPATCPAVIMLVEYRPTNGGSPTCLLARHRGLSPGTAAYSTLAGFVEPGENLEEAVAREVFEEAGVRVDNVVYQASQPWPFPASIMLGFRAQAKSTAITIDNDELEEARWFTAKEIRQFSAWEDKTAAWRLPRKDSIAWHLINAWVAEADR